MGMFENARLAFPSVQEHCLRRVLVVDDSRAQRRTLTLMLARWGFEVAEAGDAVEGLEQCHGFAPDLVISDWVMPGMSGLDFCRAFRELQRENYGYFILLTSKTDKAAVASGLESGADDFLSKPVNGDELRARINAGARILSMQRELISQTRVIADTLAQLQKVHATIDKDLQQARILQHSLMPRRSERFGKSTVSVMLRSCGHVGGDLAGMFGAESGDFGMFSLDVSGHGITSAMITARVAGYLSSRYPDENLALCKDGTDYGFLPPQDVAARLNGRMVGQPGVTEYLTMAYLQVAAQSGRARFVQAGHPPPLLLRRDGSSAFLGDGGLPIGLIEGATYTDHTVKLEPGDRVLLYSDGFTEALLPDGSMLDNDGLLDIVRSIPSALTGSHFLEAIYELFRVRTGRFQDFDDDISAAFLEYGGP